MTKRVGDEPVDLGIGTDAAEEKVKMRKQYRRDHRSPITLCHESISHLNP